MDLATNGISRGRVWTAIELIDLLRIPGLTESQARTVALAKMIFDGHLLAIHPRPKVPKAARPMGDENAAGLNP